MSEAASTRRIVDGADLVAEPDGDGRSAVILDQENIEAIVELVVTDRFGLGRGRERSQDDGLRGRLIVARCG